MHHAHQPWSTCKSSADIARPHKGYSFIVCGVFFFLILVNLDLLAKPLADLDTEVKENEKRRGRPFSHLYWSSKTFSGKSCPSTTLSRLSQACYSRKQTSRHRCGLHFSLVSWGQHFVQELSKGALRALCICTRSIFLSGALQRTQDCPQPSFSQAESTLEGGCRGVTWAECWESGCASYLACISSIPNL